MTNYERFMRKPLEERIRIMEENQQRVCERCGKTMRAKHAHEVGEYTLCKKCAQIVENDGDALLDLIS